MIDHSDRWKYARWALFGWLVAVLLLTLMPVPGRGGSLNLRPGDDLDYSWGQLNFAVNVVLFLPGGVLARLARIRRLAFPVVVLATAALSIAIEVTQYYGEVGRQTDVNDVIANALGCAIGFAAVVIVDRVGSQRRA